MRFWRDILIKFWLACALLLTSAFFCYAVEIPKEYQRFIIDRASNKEGFLKKLCESLEICQQLRFDRSVAIVIGQSQYKYLPPLETTSKDAENVKNYLLNSGEFDEVVFLSEADATLDVINFFMEDYFPDLLKRSGLRTRFLFYFSGHGESTPNGDGTVRGYLRLVNNRKDEYASSIRMDTVANWATENIGAATHSLFLIDSCVSGLIIPESKTVVGMAFRKPAELAKFREGSILTAGAAEDKALAGEKWGGSLFTKSILDALTDINAIAGSSDGLISSYELFDYVQRRVASESNNTQTPRRREFRKEKDGDFFFLAPIPQHIEISSQSSNDSIETKGKDGARIKFAAGESEEALWQKIKDSRNTNILHAFVSKYGDSKYSKEAQERLDSILNDASKNLPKYESWKFWRDSSFWGGGIFYCPKILEFLQETTQISNFRVLDSGSRLSLSKFEEGKLNKNYAVRYGDDTQAHYCLSGHTEDYKLIACSRVVTSEPNIFDIVFAKSRSELKSCLESQGWIDESSKDKQCQSDTLLPRHGCSYLFSRGPQDVWLYGGKKSNNVFYAGLQVSLNDENNNTRIIQGRYEFVDTNLRVTSQIGSKKVVNTYDGTGNILRHEEAGQSYDYTYRPDGSISEAERHGTSGNTEKISVLYNAKGQPERVKSTDFGTMLLSYGEKGYVTNIEVINIGHVTLDRGPDGDLVLVPNSKNGVLDPGISHQIVEIYNRVVDSVFKFGNQ